jgi:parallel beta-helix repeat protein
MTVSNCEIARNGWHGLLVSESEDIKINGNLIEANDGSGIKMEYLFNGSKNIQIEGNYVQFNARNGLISHATRNLKTTSNSYTLNANGAKQEYVTVLPK